MPRQKDVRVARKPGRPRKADAPNIDYNELDRLLVFGEVVPAEKGEGTFVSYPTYRELGERFKVTHTSIYEYAAKHNCVRRRIDAEARIRIKADQKIIEMRATAIALSKDDELRIIDAYMSEFERALGEGRVRFDSPADFNTMARLKEFLQGGADGRQEIHASLTLEDIQARYRRAQNVINAPAQERGEVEVVEAPPTLAASASIFPPPPEPAETSPELIGPTPGRFHPPDSTNPAGTLAIAPPAGARVDAVKGADAEPRRAGPRWPAAAAPASASTGAAIAAEAGEGVATSGAVAPAPRVSTPDPQNSGVSGTFPQEFAGGELAPEVRHGDEAEEEP